MGVFFILLWISQIKTKIFLFHQLKSYPIVSKLKKYNEIVVTYFSIQCAKKKHQFYLYSLKNNYFFSNSMSSEGYLNLLFLKWVNFYVQKWILSIVGDWWSDCWIGNFNWLKLQFYDKQFNWVKMIETETKL